MKEGTIMKKLLYISVNSKPEDLSASKTVARKFINKFLQKNKDFQVEEIDLYKEESFEKLFKKVFVGEDKEKIIEKAKSMNRFYTPEQEKEYGVVGIKIEIIK
jgi:FMN-dependent NADH-azoreductase